MKQLPVRYKPDSEAYRIQLLQLRDATDRELVRVERRGNFPTYHDRGFGEAAAGLSAVLSVLCFLAALMLFIVASTPKPQSVILINSERGTVERVQ